MPYRPYKPRTEVPRHMGLGGAMRLISIGKTNKEVAEALDGFTEAGAAVVRAVMNEVMGSEIYQNRVP